MASSKLKEKKTGPLYKAVFNDLRAKILSGEYEPGSQIETEPELVEKYDTSLITIRQAVQMLTDDQLLDKQQGRGTFVPAAVRKRMRVLGVCGLDLGASAQRQIGPYHSHLFSLSEQEASRLGIGFEMVWMATNPIVDSAQPYLTDDDLRQFFGFLFIGCGKSHALLKQVRELRLRHVSITPRDDEYNGVCLDHAEAVRLALSQFSDDRSSPLLVMGIDSLRTEVEAAAREGGYQLRPTYLTHGEPHPSFEAAGYAHMSRLIEAGENVSRILFLDDIVARGATRALLKAGVAADAVKLVVIGGKQEMIPLGFPATLVVSDMQDQVGRAFLMLEEQRRQGSSSVPSYSCRYDVLQG